MSFIARRPKPFPMWNFMHIADRIAYVLSCLIVGSMAALAIGAYVSMVVHIRWF